MAGRAREVPGCAGRFVTPGEVLLFAAEGFAGNASVSFVGKWASLGGVLSGDLAVPAETADPDGTLTFSWPVPDTPSASVDAAPRVYAIQGSGTNPAGETHTAYMLEPLVAYPDTVPCAVPDSATTPLGTTIRVDVLANDAAPEGGQALSVVATESSVDVGG
ncbi:hypothetical protein [Candidatus Poriferisodalis sp.]|uniref:hypothetical protein n=1 Tax=Candidatus Poriferisodalis sp. TaxID=3101277 RepID=UPI003B012ABB